MKHPADDFGSYLVPLLRDGALKGFREVLDGLDELPPTATEAISKLDKNDKADILAGLTKRLDTAIKTWLFYLEHDVDKEGKLRILNSSPRTRELADRFVDENGWNSQFSNYDNAGNIKT